MQYRNDEGILEDYFVECLIRGVGYLMLCLRQKFSSFGKLHIAGGSVSLWSSYSVIELGGSQWLKSVFLTQSGMVEITKSKQNNPKTSSPLHKLCYLCYLCKYYI
jgi:hypothetical protein